MRHQRGEGGQEISMKLAIFKRVLNYKCYVKQGGRVNEYVTVRHRRGGVKKGRFLRYVINVQNGKTYIFHLLYSY